MSLVCFVLLVQLFEAYAEVIFKNLTENQSLELSWSRRQEHSNLKGLYLYHRSAQSQTTLLSMTEGSKLRVHWEHKERLQTSGGLHSLQVNVTISHLQHSDTGLYMWELSYRDNSSEQNVVYSQKVFLLVQGTSGTTCQCSENYPSLLLVIFTAVVLLLLTLGCLAIERCRKTKHHSTPQSPPIYEEMTRKQQSTGSSQNNHEAPSHLEEANFPVYANPNITQQQENYYACPRQLALRP
ncbi:uncharacterized protein LOC128378452 [Scomber japonicus]|uniref:uncharacterized protein LOC128378452 n=1 Tax=Scomber japonicus TaxID=13676 RepID=UPI0023052A3F|nr:uncharacterized protein LOC128378452 [Scomber japonicus]